LTATVDPAATTTTTVTDTTATDLAASTATTFITTDPALIGLMGPTDPSALLACIVPGTQLAASVSELTLLVASPLAGVASPITLLGQGLTNAISTSGLQDSLSDVIEHVRDLAGDSQKTPDKHHGGTEPRVPTPVPAPLPPAPAEQSSGSSVSVGSHGHNKGGSSYVILTGALLVLYLRPLVLARLGRSNGCSRAFRPLALPG